MRTGIISLTSFATEPFSLRIISPSSAPTFKIALSVIVVVHQRRNQRRERVEFRVVVEAVPEDRFGLFRLECWEFVATARGDEVDRVVAVPVLEAVLSLEEFVAGRIAATEASHERERTARPQAVPLEWHCHDLPHRRSIPIML